MLHLQCIFVTLDKVIDIRERNPGYYISYYITSGETNQTEKTRDSYQWLQVPGQCSTECGGGVQTGKYFHIDNTRQTKTFPRALYIN